MNSRFPHLPEDAKFPGISTVNPYAIKNAFDYTRWVPGTTIKVCNVNWCGDYENVVKFDDDAARDSYFDGIDSPSHTLESAMRILPGSTVKLPIPFDELVQYNYLMVDFSTATSESQPIPYETDTHTRRFFYFVRDARYTAPNTTECVIDLDIWTTYINRVDIEYMMLERGHAPMMETTVEEYLSNPLQNNRYLLAEDVAYGQPAAVTSSEYIPFGNGEKYALIATTFPLESLQTLGSLNAISPAAPGYYSTGERDGQDAGVNGAVIAAGGIDYSGLNVATVPASSATGATPNGYTVFAVSARDAFKGGFFDAVAEQAPQFLEGIEAVYILDESMLKLGDRFTILEKHSMTWRQLASTGLTWDELASSGHTYAEIDRNAFDYWGTGTNGYSVYTVEPNNDIIKHLSFEKADFAYPAEYADVAKLYTYPYACLEVSDDSGNTSVIKIEDTGALNVSQRVALAYPYIRFEAFLDGVGTDASNEYIWVDLNGEQHRLNIPKSDYRDYTFGFDFPTYAVHMRGYDRYRMHNYNTVNVQGRTEKVLTYENAVHSANNTLQNALDSANKDFTNRDASITTDKANSNLRAEASYRNALDSNSTGQANANATAGTAYRNAQSSADTGKANALGSNSVTFENSIRNAGASRDTSRNSIATDYANTNLSATAEKSNMDNVTSTNNKNNALAISFSLSKTSKTNATAATNTRKANSLNQALQAWNAGYSRQLQLIESTQAFVSMAGNLGCAMVQGAAQDMTGNPIGAVGTFAHGVNSSVQSIASVAAGAAATEAGVTLSQKQVDETSRNSTEIMTGNTTLATDLTTLETDTKKTQVDNDTQVGYTNAANSYNATTQNAKKTRDTGNQNADISYNATADSAQATKNVSDANASRSRDTSVSNAANTRDMSNANASRSRATGDGNAKRSYDAALNTADSSAATGRANNYRDLALSKANAGHSRDTAVSNAQRTLSTGLELARQGYLDKRLDPAVTICTPNGDAVPDELRWRGVQVKVKTQKPGDIAPAGDQMLRYGYMLNQVWAFTGFNIMKYFTYWKCSDLWLTGGAGVIEGAQERLKEILKRGVTIWKDPDKIGTVSIYGNF